MDAKDKCDELWTIHKVGGDDKFAGGVIRSGDPVVLRSWSGKHVKFANGRGKGKTTENLSLDDKKSDEVLWIDVWR